ncbi:MAG: Potassium-transporting ATPase KdpC subunit [Myxococcota bacterium]|nr:Potassium-transporting ATPase KdpC subunit [Myxococcota bacterium]
MFSTIRPAVSLLALFTLLTGVAYPLVVTGAAQAIFPTQANGSLIESKGQVMGSRLIGQSFDDARYFWGRPSATGPGPYNAAASAGSNLGPTNPALTTAVRERVAALRVADPEQASVSIPVDLVTTSGSGLDPHISPAAALYQVHRVARTRRLAEERVRALVLEHVEARSLGFLGEPRVNVLLLNAALDELADGGA